MADNTNPEAIRFCNERVRPLADALAQVYFLSRAVRAEWYANNLGALLPSADTVMDGSAQDGRHPITGNDAAGIITRADEFITDYEAGGSAKLNTVLAVAVNPTR